MDSLEYSTDALEAKNLFYNKSITVYVEGPDDVLFWQYLFKVAEISAHIEDVGGNKEIEKYILKLLDENASFIVACDNDHSDFIQPQRKHPNLIRTYGYSIENSMYNFRRIEDIVSRLCRQRVDVKHIIEDWAEDFTNKVYDLLKFDIANHKYNKGVTIFGDSSIRFLKSNTSPKISIEKINEYLESVKNKFSEIELSTVENLINTSKKEFWFLIKGHFLTNATINLIKSLVNEYSGNSCSISSDMIYTLTIDCTQNWENRIDILTVINEIRKIKRA